MKSFLDIFKKKREKLNLKRSMFEKQDVSVNMYSHFNIEKNLEEKCINLNDYLRMPSYITISRKSLEEITDFFEELTTKSNNPEANNKILK